MRDITRMKNKVIIPTGYMGSGSSAVTDFLNGIEGVDVSRSTFEFVFLHCPNGVFDLEDKLLLGNNAVRSDEAIHSFKKTMRQLYDKKYWWVGHYKELVGDEFWKLTEEYIDHIVQFAPEYYWYYQENVTAKMLPGLFLNKFKKILSRGKCTEKKVLSYEDMLISYVKPEEFYSYSQEYIYRIFEIMGKKDKHLVLDQLLLPFNLFRFEHYFKQDVEVFVIDRDPRDIFITNKYYWSKNNEPIPYPIDVKQFCAFYRNLRQMERKAENPQIHRIHFEDMIYQYEHTARGILDVLGMENVDLKSMNTKFNPEISINNTQLFLQNEKYRKEAEIIERELQEYLYSFPYAIAHNEKEIF